MGGTTIEPSTTRSSARIANRNVSLVCHPWKFNLLFSQLVYRNEIGFLLIPLFRVVVENPVMIKIRLFRQLSSSQMLMKR